jgi:UDP-N-acetylglucosamine 2-epimerase (non-hydrolysing)
MYEERNRIMVDSIAHYLFAYTSLQAAFLNTRQELRGKVFTVGNTTIDLIEDFKNEIKMPPEHSIGYVYMTLHRKELTDDVKAFKRVIDQINDFSIENNKTIIWPLHPRSKDVLQRANVDLGYLNPLFKVIDPVPAFQSLSYEKYADLMITDSGCIQEEVCIFQVPCVTVRKNTERPETLEIGANVLSGFRNVKMCAEQMIKYSTRDWKQPYGIYGVGERIVATIKENL